MKYISTVLFSIYIIIMNYFIIVLDFEQFLPYSIMIVLIDILLLCIASDNIFKTSCLK